MLDDDSVDLLIVGGGPAGCAAAITALSAGLTVTIIEQSQFPRHRPGESLHPGIQPLLAQLGVEQAVLQAGFTRFNGIWQEGHTRHFEAFGQDSKGPWRGFQAPRETFDLILLDRAKHLGATILQNCKAIKVLHNPNGVTGLQTSQGPILARCVIDASGSRQWLSSQLQLPIKALSAPLFVRYGYVTPLEEERGQDPVFKHTKEGWLWLANIDSQTTHWTQLSYSQDTLKQLHKDIAKRKPIGKTRGADVTWRAVEPMAAKGYFLVGDAAFILDPTSSHGVLRAIMSGIYAAHLFCQQMSGRIVNTEIPRIYQQWMSDWLEADMKKLSTFYQGQMLSDSISPRQA